MSNKFIIRKAISSDIKAMVALSYIKRRDYEKAQPQFWKYAQGAEDTQAKWFKELLKKKDYILLVAESQNEIVGFVIGRILPAPEVYNPGGLTLMVDDFCVESSNWNQIGAMLVSELKRLAKEKGAVQMVVVSGTHDNAKLEFLKSIGLTSASEWYLGSI